MSKVKQIGSEPLWLALVVSIFAVEAIELQEQHCSIIFLLALFNAVCDLIEASVGHVGKAHLPALAAKVRRETSLDKGCGASVAKQSV